MKRFARLLGIFIFSFLGLKAVAQTKQQNASSLLWQITHPTTTDTSYVLGTMHIYCPSEFPLVELVSPYLNRAKQLVLEVDIQKLSEDSLMMQRMMEASMLPADSSLNKLLTADQLKQITPIITDSLQVPMEMAVMLRPWALQAMVQSYLLPCAQTGMEIDLIQNVSSRDLPILGLETMEDPLKALNSTSLTEQVQELYKRLSNMDSTRSEIRELITVYYQQDIQQLFKLIDDDADPTGTQLMLHDRNKRWLPLLEKYLKTSSFVAVGAGHLAGPTGVLTLLEAAGYTIHPLPLPYQPR